MGKAKDFAALAMVLQNALKAVIAKTHRDIELSTGEMLRAQEEFVLDIKKQDGGNYVFTIAEADDRGGALRADPGVWTPDQN